MPELPEVEVLVRHLAPLLKGRVVHGVTVRRERVIRPNTDEELSRSLVGARFQAVSRRAKFLLFDLQPAAKSSSPVRLVGHLGMTGRMYLLPVRAELPKHTAVVLDLGKHRFVYEDVRYFGRLSLDDSSLADLGPEPLSDDFDGERLHRALAKSTQAIKVRLLDQTVVAGVGNIYASEALFRAGVSPRRAAGRLTKVECVRLAESIRAVLQEAIDCGSTIPLDFSGGGVRDGLFYYGLKEGEGVYYEEHLRVYDRAGKPCLNCQTPVRRIVQAARSTFYCPRCQR